MTLNPAKSIDWKLDRDLNITIAEQIKGKILYSISFGFLHPGDALPSVRELAQILQVSPVTVSKVYKELTQDGLLVSKPSVGVFVSELGIENGRQNLLSSNANLEQIFENSIRQARFLGYTLDEISEAWSCIEQRIRNQEKKKTIVLVGIYENATQFYAKQIEMLLRDLNVEIVPITIGDLISRPEVYRDLLSKSSLVVTLPKNIKDLRNILRPNQCRVVAVAFELSSETIQELSGITPDQRVGIISSLPEFVQIMVDELESYGLNIHPPKIALINESERISEILRNIDVLVYASGSEQVLDLLPADVTAIELLHRPKVESVNRLRSLIT